MNHHKGSEEEQTHPLYFLQRNPVVSILGDPLRFDLNAQALTIGTISKTNPVVCSFVLACLHAIISQDASAGSVLSMRCFTDSDRLVGALRSYPCLPPSLELLCVLASHISACSHMDGNAVAAGSESDLHERILKDGKDGALDFTRFQLARRVIAASKSLADVCKHGAAAVGLAYALEYAASARADDLQKFASYHQRLLIPAEGHALIGELQDVQANTTIFDLATVVQGRPDAIAAAQEHLALEHGVLSLLQPGAFLKLEQKHRVPDASFLAGLMQDADLSFLGADEARHIQLLKLMCQNGGSDNKAIEEAVRKATAADAARHITVLGICAGAHLLFSCKAKLFATSRDVPIRVDCIDVLGEVQKGNFKVVDRERPVNLSAVKGTAAESIAVVGMSCRVPGAEGTDAFWQNLLDGKDCCAKIPERLFRIEDYQSKAYKDRNTMRASTGNFIDRSGFWDPHAFGIDVEEAKKLDPQQRLAMLVAMEALEMSGYAPKPGTSSDPATMGTILGCCSDDYLQNRASTIEAPFVSALLRSNIPVKINKLYGWGGPAITLDTACSGSLVAVESACNYLLQGKCSAVLTGGVNVLTQPQIFIGLDRGFFLSPTGQCKTLDDKGDGYSRADAVSMVVLKRLSDAVNEGDNILGVVNSAATNHSGESYSITHPHFQTQRRLYRSSMLAAKLDSPNDVNYAELHGTGTAAGDFEEMSGIVTTYAKTRPQAQPLVIGSVKANVGHSESTSGATSLLKTLLVFKNSFVPRHIGIRTQLNSKLPDLSGIHIPIEGKQVVSSRPDADDRVFSVSNFSAAAGNTALVLRAPPRVAPRQPPGASNDATPSLFVVTGATLRSLKDNADSLLAFLAAHPDTDVRELCYVLTAQRRHHKHRISGLVSSIDDIRAIIAKHEVKTVQETERPKTAFVFSGQGSQYLNMGKELFESSPLFAMTMRTCDDAARALGFGGFLDAIYTTSQEEPSPVHNQLAIVSLELALVALLRTWGLEPVAVLGHSLGEYAALHAAGVLSLHDTIRLVGSRAQLMVKHCQQGASSMLAVKALEEDVLGLLAKAGVTDCEIACFNSVDDLVLAGPLESIKKVKSAADAGQPKIKSMLLSVPYAFHSAAVQPLVEPYLPVASLAKFAAPKTRIAANNGKIVDSSGAFSGHYLVQHLRNPVRFANAVDALAAETAVDCFIELGPHATCTPMLRSIFASQLPAPALVPTLKKGVTGTSALTTSLLQLFDLGVQLDWHAVHESLGRNFANAQLVAALPTYSFDLENHWIDYADRHLRDHLVHEKFAKATRAAPVDLPRTLPFPAPKFSLLTSCTKLDLKEPNIASFDALINKRPFMDMVMGHEIVGFPLTPANVFVELALEAVSYVLEQDSGVPVSDGLEVSNLAMFSSLFPDPKNPHQTVQVELVGSPFASGGATVSFFSRERASNQSHQHGSCTITATNAAAMERDWKRVKHLVSDRIAALRRAPATTLRREMVYRRFQTIVKYSPPYQGIDRAYLDLSGTEGASEVYLQPFDAGGDYVCSPMLLDSLGALSGFLSNVGIAAEGQVYIADGIGRIVTTPQLAKVRPGDGKQLLAWARMEPSSDRCVGDVWFTNPSHEFIGCMEDVVFKKLKRSALERLVGMGSAAAMAAAQPAATHAPESSPSAKKSKLSDSALFLRSEEDVLAADHVRLAGLSIPSTGMQPVFLLPDGSGSAGCFANLLPTDWPTSVFGLNSPFLGADNIDRWTGGIAQLSAAFFQSIVELQPEGPYTIGGYSMGACCAVEVARMLAATGRNVETLVLLECPALNKKHLPPLPPGSLDAILAKVDSPAGRRHFERASKAVPGHSFSFDWPEPSKVVVINAVDESLTPDLMTSKPQDWKEVFKVADVSVQTCPGNHQTFLKGALEIVSQIIQ